MSEAIQRRFEAALELAREAGRMARAFFDDPDRQAATLKGAQDWLTAADGAVERFLSDRLASLFPDDGFLGEEGGDARHAGGGLRWIVDPIDGTSNFARGRERWCVSVGLFEGDLPLLGVIDAPVLGECFAGRRGGGATLNGRPIAHSGCADVTRAMIEFGWSPRADKAAYLATAAGLLRAGAMPRAGGSGALGLMDVACGRVDAFIELHIQLWDVAAALAILGETEALVEHRGLPGPIVAASPGLGFNLVRVDQLAETKGSG